MLCDLHRYELSVSGSMIGNQANPLVDSILRLPAEVLALIDLQDVDVIDDKAAGLIAAAMLDRTAEGAEFSVVVSTDAAAASFSLAGIDGAMLRPVTSWHSCVVGATVLR